jgi:hypothetical protein
MAPLVRQLASSIASTADLPCFLSASSAKSIIMMAFFLTIPISKNDPDERDDGEVDAAEHQGQQRVNARAGQRRENRDRVNVRGCCADI